MRLIDANKVQLKLLEECQNIRYFDKDRKKLQIFADGLDFAWVMLDNQPTIKAIPIEVFYKMIHNALADTKKENWEPEECPYDYFDGNRNAIHCMLDILCGDKDGDHDDFWKEYMEWEKENE